MRHRKYTKEILEEVVKKSTSISNVLANLGLAYSGGNHNHIKSLIRYFNIDISHFTGSAWSRGKTSLTDMRIKMQAIRVRKSDEDFFCENSTPASGYMISKRLLENGREYKCEKCNNGDTWMGEKITLQVDHINGIHNDNRINNLRFLCPNCHSQTLTWGNKGKLQNTKQKNLLKENDQKLRFEKKCKMCGCVVSKKSKGVCAKCYNENRKCGEFIISENNKKFDVSSCDLTKYINEMPLTSVAKMFGVSDNAIRKRCKKLGIDIPKFPRGYWLEKNMCV